MDEHGRVPGADGIYAAGDVTTFPLKQGGLATQQADAAVEAMLAALGVPIMPRPFEPVLKGVLYTDREPAYLRATLAGEGPSPARSRCGGRRARSPGATWRPISRSAPARRARPRCGPSSDAIPVSVDIPRAVHAVSNALDLSAVPPG